MISLYTTTSFFCPIRNALSTACLSSAGFQEGSKITTRSAPGGWDGGWGGVSYGMGCVGDVMRGGGLGVKCGRE